MLSVFSDPVRAALAPPRYISLPLAGIDISTSGVKVARLRATGAGPILDAHAQVRLPLGVVVDGEIVQKEAMVDALVAACKFAGVTQANVSLPETKAYLFEVVVPGETKEEWRVGVEQRLSELVPLPREEALFDIVGVGSREAGTESVVGVGFARRMVNETLSVFDEAGIQVRALEEETFAMARALIPRGEMATILIIDIGKTTTKLSIVSGGTPRSATTFGIGGHALTLAVQKHFGVTEEEARRVKAEKGIVAVPGNEEYLEAMLSTVSAIRDEISTRLQYWREHAVMRGFREPVSRIILSGGNASLRGLPEYLEGELGIPVVAGDVFTNLASRDVWIPSLDYTESLAFSTAVGLALRDYQRYE